MRALFVVLVALLATWTRGAEPINEMCPLTPEEPAESYITADYQGQTIGFCCKSCLRKFNADPEAYLTHLQIDTLANDAGANVSQNMHDQEHVHATKSIIEKSPHDSEAHAHAAEKEAEMDLHKLEEHDHDTDHAYESNAFFERLWVVLGKLHVIVLHLPIALLTVAALLEIIGCLNHREQWFFAARVNFIIGSVFAVVAAIFGWIAANSASYSGELRSILDWHRWLGISVAVIAMVGLLSLAAKRLDCDWGKPFYRLSLCALAVLIPITAHFGGSLIYGINYLNF